MLVVSCGQHSHPFDFNFRGVVEQSGYLDQDHGWKMFSHVLAITFTDVSGSFMVLVFIRHVDHESDDMLGLTAAGLEYSYHVSKRLIELFDEVIADDPLDLIPRYLTGNEK